MIARVVTKRDDARLALVVTSLAALGLALVLADDLWRLHWLPGPRAAVFTVVAAMIAAGGVGPWLAWTRRRGRATVVRCEEGGVRLGARLVRADHVRSLSIARALRGFSVAIGHGEVGRARELTFVEVERAEEAARIASALGVREPPFGEPRLRPRSRMLALPQALLSLVAVVFAAGYMVTTQGYISPSSLPDPKALFGLGGVVAAELSMVLLVARSRSPHQALGLSRKSAWDAHLALHTRGDARAARDEASDAASERGAPAAPVQRLGRGDEAIGSWLARIDALPTEHHAYRGDAMKKDVLWETLGDGGAPVSARMAAARVLRRRYGEEEAALVRVVEDPDVRVRVEAAMEEHEEAERHLETLGPLFRAR